MKGAAGRLPPIPAGWPRLFRETGEPYFRSLERRLARAQERFFPASVDIFRALKLTPSASVRVVILGQDPYHRPGQANGLAFSVNPGVAPPPSLKNIYAELRRDLGVGPPEQGDLTPWAARGVLLLNAVLTVPEGRAGGHAGWGWELFTDAVIRAVAEADQPAVFLLWGKRARARAGPLAGTRHVLLETSHPSPLSAHRGFLGSACFSRANEALAALGRPAVDWSLVASRPGEARPLLSSR
ncbi:MAG: uracil-DNA glycosylase [Gemmatimonadota bacterium]